VSEQEQVQWTVFGPCTWIALAVGAGFLMLVGALGLTELAPAESSGTYTPTAGEEGAAVSAAFVYAYITCAVVAVSCIWLVSNKIAGRDMLEFGPPPAASWTGLDALAVALAQVELVALIGLALWPGGPAVLIAAYSLVQLAIVCMMLRAVRLRGQSVRHAFGLDFRGLARPLVSGLAAFGVFLPVFLIISHYWIQLLQLPGQDPGEHLQGPVKQMLQSPSPELLVQLGLVAIIVAPLAEELFFRGFLYGALKRLMQPWVAMMAVGMLFGLMHSPLAATVPMFLFGMMLCYIYEKTGRLIIPITIHVLFNLATIGQIVLTRYLAGGGT